MVGWTNNATMSLSSSANWLRGQAMDYLRRGYFAVLRAGPIPQHIAFVMDGNRRHARSNGMNVLQGHVEGVVALKKMLEICFILGIKFVSIYAFSIDNFKRPEAEVDVLMYLITKELQDICKPGYAAAYTFPQDSTKMLVSHRGLLDRHQVRLNIVGRTDLFPPAVQAAMDKAKEYTADNRRAALNFCVAYSSRDEIAMAVNETIRVALLEGRTEEVTERDIEDRLMTTKVNSPPLDILIRTSGVKRLSDFLLWQCADDTQIHFIDIFWPDIGLLDLLPIILEYQRKVWYQ